jgi:hypothetical protein
MGLTKEELETPGVGLQIGMEPLRFDILTKVTGPAFAEAWPGHVEAEFAPGVSVPMIGLEALLANKRAAGRPQDLADVHALEKLRAVRDK